VEYLIGNEEGGTKTVSLVGIINEDAPFVFQKLEEELAEASHVAFLFSQVRSINSLGVRAWVSFLRGLEERVSVSFRECTPDVIMQINMIPNFQGKAQIESFYVNYFCDVCGYKVQKLMSGGSLPVPPACPQKHTPQPEGGLQTEELEEEYFAFLTRQSGNEG